MASDQKTITEKSYPTPLQKDSKFNEDDMKSDKLRRNLTNSEAAKGSSLHQWRRGGSDAMRCEERCKLVDLYMKP